MSITQAASRGIALSQDVALAFVPHGGQLQARRNALRALAEGRVTALDREEVARATAAMVAQREERDRLVAASI
jgi:hypothetical protein